MADVTDIIEYYTNLLIVQYFDKPDARATIALLAETMLASGVYLDVLEGYNLDTAVGLQLDVIGKYANVDRKYNPSEFTGFYSSIVYSQVPSPPVQLGMTNYTDYPLPAGEVLTYSQMIGGNALLSDDSFRILIRLAIITNNSNFSHKSIDDNIFAIFGDEVIPSSFGNMVMWYFIPTAQTALLTAAFQKDLLPHPMGVRLAGLIPVEPSYFGFSTYSGASPFISGFSTYSDYGTTSGETLIYDDIIH